MNRKDVYAIIDGEREFQDSKPARPVSDADTSVAEWLTYIEYHLNAAKGNVYHLDRVAALSSIRKIAALCVACMENNNTPPRSD